MSVQLSAVTKAKVEIKAALKNAEKAEKAAGKARSESEALDKKLKDLKQEMKEIGTTMEPTWVDLPSSPLIAPPLTTNTTSMSMFVALVLFIRPEAEGIDIISKQTGAEEDARAAAEALMEVEKQYEEATKASDSLKQKEVELTNQLEDVSLTIRNRRARVRALASAPCPRLSFTL